MQPVGGWERGEEWGEKVQERTQGKVISKLSRVTTILRAAAHVEQIDFAVHFQ